MGSFQGHTLMLLQMIISLSMFSTTLGSHSSSLGNFSNLYPPLCSCFGLTDVIVCIFVTVLGNAAVTNFIVLALN